MPKQKTDPEELERNHVTAILEKHRDDLHQALYEIDTKYKGDWEESIVEFLANYYNNNSGVMYGGDPLGLDEVIDVIAQYHKEMIDELIVAIRNDDLNDYVL